MGKLAFLKLADDSGEVQLYVDRSALDERREGSFAEVKSLVDVGDIVGCHPHDRRNCTVPPALFVGGTADPVLAFS